MRLVGESSFGGTTPAAASRVAKVAPPQPSRIRVLGADGDPTNEALVATWRRLGFAAVLLQPGDVLGTVGRNDIVVSRLDVEPGLDGIEPGLLELLLLERRGVRIINSAAALLGVHDKLRTARLLSAAGVPHPRTALITPGRLCPGIGLPLVLKPRFGSWGRDIYCCLNEPALAECLDAVMRTSWFERHGAIAQELIRPCGHDLSVVVANGRVVGAAERSAAPGEWRTNVSLGGSLRPTGLSDDAVELARTAAAAVNADLVGVDLLPIRSGYTVLDLNGAVEFDYHYSIGDRDVFTDVARALDLPSPQIHCVRRHGRKSAAPTTSAMRKERS